VNEGEVSKRRGQRGGSGGRPRRTLWTILRILLFPLKELGSH